MKKTLELGVFSFLETNIFNRNKDNIRFFLKEIDLSKENNLLLVPFNTIIEVIYDFVRYLHKILSDYGNKQKIHKIKKAILLF
ncbi:hypothetical protein MFLO_05780 [Listeria floridensis FSL S10-1187]|uniref:Uncharacterized protein n=1 Tax=Listeria floridensis FSL S10-1187 TaxID=1265817 RepID=A0ABN0RGS6_9LIST|nr:hypothetical protein MFLO_05780 [Listeria floridensis FSL S10-1187]